MKAIYCPAGRMEVGVANRFDDNPRTVRLVAPDGAELTPDTARSVAIALIEHAAIAQRHNQQQRSG